MKIKKVSIKSSQQKQPVLIVEIELMSWTLTLSREHLVIS